MSFVRRYWLLGFFIAAITCAATSASAQIINQAIGGVRVDGDGVLVNLTQVEKAELAQLRKAQLQAPSEAFVKGAKLRKISLSKLLQTLVQLAPQSADEVPPEIALLGGMTRVQYVLVYPDQHDIVLAGPCEPWTTSASGEVVGAQTGKPFVRLEDLIEALATTESAEATGVTCSIEPTAEGLRNLEQLSRAGGSDSPELTAKRMAEAVGSQSVKLGGCEGSSHFAQVLVAADYRMKRLAMKLDPAAVRELPSFMDLASRTRLRNSMPRWWMADNYEALERDADGLAWKLNGAGVKTLAEEDFFANGERKESHAAHSLAQKWADLMTAHFEELATAEPIFGELRNCMDLSVIAALIRREKLAEKASFDLAAFIASAKPCCRSYAVPSAIASEASLVRQSKGWLVSVSGGVDIDPYKAASQQTEAAGLKDVHVASISSGNAWFWE